MNSTDLDPATKAEIFFRVLIYIVGVVGNILVIFVVLFLKEYKKIVHWYVLQLAISDILFLQTLPFRISELIHGKSHESTELCRARQTILYLNYYASILLLMVMALDRYLAVCHALSTQVQRFRNHVYSMLITLAVWVIAALCCIPVYMYSELVGVQPSCLCSLKFPVDKNQWCEDNYSDDMLNCTTGEHDHNFRHDVACFSSSRTDYSAGGFGFSGSGSGQNATHEENSALFDSMDFSDYFGDTDFSDKIHPECMHDHTQPGLHIYVIFNFVAMFIIPLFVISACYGLIVIRILKTNVGDTQNSNSESTYSRRGSGVRIWSRKRRRSSNASTGKSYREKRRVTVMCAVLVLLFLVCWLPFHSIHLAKIVGIPSSDGSLCNILSKAASLLAYLNAAFNPYVYNFLGTFQKRMRFVFIELSSPHPNNIQRTFDRQVRSHKRMRSILSATGLTRLGLSRSKSGSVANSSDGSKAKQSSVRNESRYTNPQSEGIPLQTFQDKSTASS